MEITSYGLSRERGFLSHYEVDEIKLPRRFDAAVEAAQNLSGLLSSGRIRHWLDQLRDPDITEWVDTAPEEQVRTAMVRYSFLVQAYVWGEDTPPEYLPCNLARPIVALGERLDQAPLLPYSAYVLDNWARLDKTAPATLDNIRMVQNFSGGDDENWFVLVHVAIEAQAGVLLDNACKLVAIAANCGDPSDAEHLLIEMHAAWERIYENFARMPERCDPYVYFHRVRPYIHGWANNPALDGGLIYQGVDKYAGTPQAFRGQTGSQSSIVPAMDALFQVRHSDDPLKSFLDELHAYRPIEHRRFIDDLARNSRLRSYVAESDSSDLRRAFNACLEQTTRFRTRHLEYDASYINKQAGSIAGNDPDVGTGGTPFMRYLKKHRDENRDQTV